MTFPDTPLPIVVELLIDGVWTDITDDVQQREDITIVRGKQNGSSGLTQATSCSLTLNNRNGTYSPRNPIGTYFGKIGRNTKIRVKVGLSSGNVRFTGEVSSWPAKWDVSGNDAWVEIEAAGVLRRANQGAAPSINALEDKIRSLGPHRYWPLDDPEGYRWTVVTGGQEFGGTYAFGQGSLGPYLPQALTVGSITTAMVAYTSSSSPQTDVAVDFVFQTSAGTAKQLDIWYEDFVDYTNDNFWKIKLRYDGSNNDVQLQLVEPSGTTNLGDTSALTIFEDNAPHHIRLLLQSSGGGANTDWSVWVDGVSLISGTKAGTKIQNVNSVIQVGQTGSSSVSLGHLAMWTTDTSIPSITGNEIDIIIDGYAGETAGNRAQRLIVDVGGYDLTVIGDMADTVVMGPQYEDSFLGQLAEIEATDLGMVYEPLSGGLGYRSRKSLYNQTASVSVDYSAHELSDPFEPIDDDQNTRNDIFVQRRNGNSYQATQETGPLSIQEPPDGVGRYKDEVQVNTQYDGQLADIAYFLLSLGTVDEARFPSITVDRANPHVVANGSLSLNLLTLEIGDKITITNAAAVNFYDDIELLMIGYTEVINWKKHTFKFNCVPASPYTFAVWESAVGSNTWKYDALDSELAEDLDTTETGVTIAYGSTQWTTNASECPFPINIGGERMTVTAVGAPSAGNQTLTVARSANGVVKTHLTGAAVRLWDTPRFGW